MIHALIHDEDDLPELVKKIFAAKIEDIQSEHEDQITELKEEIEELKDELEEANQTIKNLKKELNDVAPAN